MLFDSNLMTLIEATLKVGNIPALVGDPGIGKSSFCAALAEKMGTRLFTLQCNELGDRTDLTGARTIPDPVTGEMSQMFFPHVVITQAIKYANEHPGETPIMLWDEANRTGDDVTHSLLSAGTARTIGNHALPDNLKIIMAFNDTPDTVRLPEASTTRFTLIHVEPSTQTFIDVLGDDINPYVLKTLTEYPETIMGKNTMRKKVVEVDTDDDSDTDDDNFEFDPLKMAQIFDEEERMVQGTNPRTIHRLSNFLNVVDLDTLKSWALTPVTTVDGHEINMLTEVIEAHVGHTPFSIALVSNMVADFNHTPAINSSVSAPRPAAWNDTVAADDTDNQTLEAHIRSMSEEEMTKTLIYALVSKRDNERIISSINTVLPTMVAINGESPFAKIIELGTANALSSVNLSAMSKLTSGVCQVINTTLDN